MSSCSLNITFEIVDVVKQDQSEARFYYTYFKVEGNATASANPAGCVIVMPGDLVNDDEGDDEEEEDDDDERNSETAALTSSC